MLGRANVNERQKSSDNNASASEAKRRIVVLDEEFPFPLNTGKRIRSFNLYQRLASTFDITYVAYGDEQSEAAGAMRDVGIGVRAVPARVPAKEGLRFYLRLLANLFSPLPYIVTSHYSATYFDEARRAIDAIRPDLMVFEWTPYVHYGRIDGFPAMLSAHNVEADIWRRYMENESNVARRAYIREQWRKVLRFESAALAAVDGAIAVSEGDRARLVEMAPGALPITVVPNGVDLEHYVFQDVQVQDAEVVFTGSMDWRPNQDAARYFVAQILPFLLANHPETHSTFVGRDPPPDIVALGRHPQVTITGTVDDVRPFIERASVYVVPLRVGGGSRLKILEALAMGRAVVSTSVGAEGLDVTDGTNIVIADDPVHFATAVTELMRDVGRRRQLAVAGRKLVEERYGWQAIASHAARFMNDLVVSPRSLS